MGADRNNVVNDEVEKMLENDTIEEVQYPTWLANLVVVLKKNVKWKVCIDFTNLNKAYPKDNFPLPHIDMIIDSTVGHELMSFMDAFSGDNRIMMHPLNREKTSFIIERGAYCYKQLGLTMEAYIDDMLGKSKDGLEHVDHLWECFQILLVRSMRLNPAKYAFAVSSGKFFGHLRNESKDSATIGRRSRKTQQITLGNVRNVRNMPHPYWPPIGVDDSVKFVVVHEIGDGYSRPPANGASSEEIHAADDVEGKRECTLSRMQNHYSVVARQYNKKVKLRKFLLGELVLKKFFQNTEESRAGKLSINCEGPYRIVGSTGKEHTN
uniref:Uncharacterized protein n=1 Tax=Cannabis sativa TaxID=3483 RepID=A0A803Q2L9_CANSA